MTSPHPPVGSDDAGALAASVAHGHRLLEQLLPEVAGQLKHGYLVEVGTTREKVPGQGSTVILATLAARPGLPFVTVDVQTAIALERSRPPRKAVGPLRRAVRRFRRAVRRRLP